MSQWQPTTCMRCAVGCGLLQREADDTSEGIEAHGNPDHPTNGGADCERGIRETVSPEGRRLTEPLVRRGGELHPTDWDTALGIVAMRCIESLRDDTSGIAVLGSGQQTNEAAYALGKVARGGFGTPYYDANTGLCMASAVTAYDRAFGGNAPPPTYDDIPDAETHLVWGANPATAHPVLHNWIAESASDDDSRLLVVDPVESETAREADDHIEPDPGTDLALVRAVLAQVVAAGDTDTEFVHRQTVGYGRMVESLPDVEHAADTAGVSVDDVERLAAALDDPTLVYWGMGVNQSIQGTATARALIDLCLATGNMGPGTGPFSLTGQANSMGNRVCSAKETWPGHQPFESSEVRKEIASTWGVPFSRLPRDRGAGFVTIVDRIARGEIDVCWTVATNPAAGMPDASHVKSVLEDVFLVVQDSFYSDTVACADVVLPAATWGETEGTTMNMERRVSRVTAATEPPASVRQDLDIIAAIGNRIEPDLFGTPPLDPESVFDELRDLTAGTAADLSGITYDRLADELAVRWPAPDADSEGGYQYYDDGEWSFDTDSGLAAFSTVSHGGLAEPIDDAYPLTLTTGRLPGIYNTGVRSQSTEGDGLPTARMHSETIATRLSAFEQGQTVITSRRGAVTVAVETDDGIPPGIVWLPIHDAAVNTLTLPTVDPDSDEPNYKQCAVALSAPTATEPPAEPDLRAESVDS
ncbi:MAG: assimilatory nitrate reductase NasA [Halohasta sp.]